MKLTREDKIMLSNWGFGPEDFPQIQAAFSISRTKYRLNGEPIGREQAVRILGRERYLSGIARSAFHRSAVRESVSGERVFFDSSRLFKKEG